MYVQHAKLKTFQYEYEPQDIDGNKLEQDCFKDFIFIYIYTHTYIYI